MGHTLCLMRRMPSFFMSSLVARSLRRMNTHEVRFIPTAAQKNASSGFTLLVSAGTPPGRHFVCWVCRADTVTFSYNGTASGGNSNGTAQKAARAAAGEACFVRDAFAVDVRNFATVQECGCIRSARRECLPFDAASGIVDGYRRTAWPGVREPAT